MKFANLFKSLAPLGLFLVIVIVFFWKVFLAGQIPLPGDFVVGVYYPWLDYKWGYAVGVPVKNPMTTDVVSFTYPMQTLAIELIKKATPPLWNPYILAGTPLLANFQSAPFSPTNIVYFFFDTLSAWSLQIILQHVLAGLFTFILLRHWKVSSWGSLFGATIFAFGGFNLIWSQWNGHALSASFIPLVLFFVDKYLLTKKTVFGVGISFSFALMFLSGYPQVAVYLAIAIFLLWIIRVRETGFRVKETLLLGLFFAIGIGLSLFQLLPGAELLSLSQREIEGHPFEWAFLPFEKIITFIAPDYFGNHATQNYWGPQDYTSNTGFVSAIGLTLALLSLALVRKKAEVKFGVLLLVFSLLFSFATPLSIFFWKTGTFGLNAASAHRALVLFNLAVAILVGFGIDTLDSIRITPKSKWKIRPFVLAGLPFAIILAYAAYALFLGDTQIKGFDARTVALRNLILPTLSYLMGIVIIFSGLVFKKRFLGLRLSALCFLVMVELFYFGWKFTPFSPRSIVFPTTPVLDFLMAQEKPVRVTGSKVIPINMKMPYRLEALEGYDAVYPLSIAKFLAAQGGLVGTTPLGRYATVDNDTSHLLDLTNTKYYLALKVDERGKPSPEGEVPERFKEERFQKVFEDKSTVVFESKSALPRAFMVYEWEDNLAEEEILRKLLNKNFPFDGKILSSEDLPEFPRNKAYGSHVSYETYAGNESRISVQTDSFGMLFISDTFYPGWKAEVDGIETKIYKANFAFRAIPVSEGKHEVRMIYRPNSFYNGLKVSLSSAVFLFLADPFFKLLKGKSLGV